MHEPRKRRARGQSAGGTRQEEMRTNLYDEVTARIIAELEAGRLPWVQPWARTARPIPACRATR